MPRASAIARTICFMPPAYRCPGVPTTRTLRRGVDTRRRIEFWRPRTARADAGGKRPVLELFAAGCAAQQQAAAAHVAAPDERDRVAQPFSQDRQQHVNIFAARHAPEKDDPGLLADASRQRDGVPFERRAVFGIVEADVADREFAEQREREGQLWRLQPAGRRDDERFPEPLCVGQLASEVQAAHEREGGSERQPARPHLERRRGFRLWIEQDRRAASAAKCRRKKKNVLHAQ